MNGLDLFSGIGGLSIALESLGVETVAYCEKDRYAQGVLLSRMLSNELRRAPIWDDVSSLRGSMLPKIDIIFGGFPCQDISVAGRGKGLGGERSGLFFEIVRLAKETRAPLVFLENVPAIRTRGLSEIIAEFSGLGYDCRWTRLSAANIGANHIRRRWFFLANANGARQVQNAPQSKGRINNHEPFRSSEDVAHSKRNKSRIQPGWIEGETWEKTTDNLDRSWWNTEPGIRRVADGIPMGVDRIRCLGNAVVPLQAREAFRLLSGISRKAEL